MNDNHNARDKRTFARRLKEARIGDASAQYDIALMYATGVGVAKNVSQAFAWTRAAAEKGHVAAQYLLGSAYAGGLGTPRDEQKALAWFLKAHEHGNEKASFKLAKVLGDGHANLALLFAFEAAEKGLAEAQLMVADALALGLGVAVDRAAAHAWHQRAAEQGLAAAQFALAQTYEQGIDVAEDVALARQWYREAAGQGHPAAQIALNRLDAAGLGRIDSSARLRAGTRERRTTDTRWIKYASHGRPSDFYHLGLMYELGVGVEKSGKQSRLWYKKAAESGLADAQYALGQSLETVEPRQAEHWYLQAAKQDHAQAQFALGAMLAKGMGTVRDQIGALAWLSQAAAQGCAPAQLSVGTMLQGDSQELAFALLANAASAGQAEAQWSMGERYRTGLGVAQNWFEACRWYQMAAEQGHAQAQCALAACYADGNGVKKDQSHAFAWFEKAAAQNLPQAQWNLGELYATGLSGVAADPKKATQLCKRAANAGFAPASATLGALFARAKKHERAVQWWTLAAEQGDLESLFNLGQCYRLGLGVPKDEARAFELLLSAAQGGVAAAQSRVGLAYATGEGAALDPLEAMKWFELAALRGDKAAAANRERASKALSPAQQKEVQRRVKAWAAAQEIKT